MKQQQQHENTVKEIKVKHVATVCIYRFILSNNEHICDSGDDAS